MIRCDSETCAWSLYVHDKKERVCLKKDVRLEHSEEDGYNLVCESFDEDEERAEKMRRRAAESERFARGFDEGAAMRKGEL